MEIIRLAYDAAGAWRGYRARMRDLKHGAAGGFRAPVEKSGPA
jgi:hypothetical protein